MIKTEIIEEIEQFERELELQRLMQMVEEFDFKTALKMTDHLYIAGDNSIEEMKETLSGLVIDMFNNPDLRWTATGRFTVMRDIDGEIKFFFGLTNR